MEIHETACCALMEMAHISDHEGDAEEVMKEMCEQLDPELGSPIDSYNDGPPKGITLVIPGHMIFTAVVGYTTNDDEEGYGVKPSYGPNLAKFIKKNKLGAVVESPIQVNRVNHPTHKVRVYVWTPNAKNLQKWWNGVKPAERVTRSAYGYDEPEPYYGW
jgi:hypothetical protein